MLKKIGAVLLAAGLVLPYSPGVRVITAVWSDVAVILFQGSTVLILIAYVLHNFVPPLARFHERHGQGLHGLFRMVFFVLAGAFFATASAGRTGWPRLVHVIIALAITGGLLYWEQGRATKTQRLPLLLLICVGVPLIAYFFDTLHAGSLQYGGWVLTAGYAVAVVGEVLVLKATPKVAHGG
jgi:hypothetical protein